MTPVDSGALYASRFLVSSSLRGQVGPTGLPLAPEIACFPQVCMRADRMSCHRQWGYPLPEALRFEGVQGDRPLREEARAGASRFASGLGRSGSFERI